ncbi:MAG: ribonuclease P [Candidatus Diapherotrites archaeon CG08_land_8_20_14_0_20_34_12]|nr:MAG: ribonuclease P [Candidatus Diapherotrites archaeon CG08_land_8_20_14_0_20_34_12]
MIHNYKIDKENILAHEIIGLNARIKKSGDKKKEGLNGRIVDETENTIILETNDSLKTIPKKEVILELELPNNEKIDIEGVLLKSKPEDRIKVFWRKYHGKCT